MFQFEQLTVTNSAVTVLTEARYNPGKSSQRANKAVVTVEDSGGSGVRTRMDADPTTSVGHLSGNRDVIYLNTYEEIVAFKAIAVLSNITLSVTYKK